MGARLGQESPASTGNGFHEGGSISERKWPARLRRPFLFAARPLTPQSPTFERL